MTKVFEFKSKYQNMNEVFALAERIESEKEPMYECVECYEEKDGTHFRKNAVVCDECKDEEKRKFDEETDDRDDLRDR